jgi:Xaa-Pro aminopeptidase
MAWILWKEAGMSRERFDRDRLFRLMGEEGVDILVCTSQPSVTYTSGYYNVDINLMPEHHHFTVWPRDGEPVLILSQRERRLDSFVSDVRQYPIYRGDERREAIGLLAEVLGEKGAKGARVALELGHIPAGSFRLLSGLLPGVEFVDGARLLDRAKAVKTPWEIEHLRRAALATDRAIALAYNGARPTDTEKSIADAIGYYVLRFGADLIGFNVLASGPRTTQIHHHPEPVPLEMGSIVRTDFGAIFSGYYSDLARMAVVGRPSHRQRDTYKRFLEVHRRTVEAVRPGVTASHIYGVAKRAYEELGLPGRPHCGHSIGVSVHEAPMVAEDAHWVLEAGMVLCIENGGTIPEYRERYHIEDTLLVTPEGHEVLSTFSSTEEMVVIE